MTVYRFPTSGSRVLVDSGRATTFTETAIGGGGKLSLLPGRDTVYLLSTVGNATVGLYKLNVKAYGGTMGASTKLTAEFSRWYIVGAAVTSTYLAASDPQANTIAAADIATDAIGADEIATAAITQTEVEPDYSTLVATDNIGINLADVTNQGSTLALTGTQVHVYDTDSSGHVALVDSAKKAMLGNGTHGGTSFILNGDRIALTSTSGPGLSITGANNQIAVDISSAGALGTGVRVNSSGDAVTFLSALGIGLALSSSGSNGLFIHSGGGQAGALIEGDGVEPGLFVRSQQRGPAIKATAGGDTSAVIFEGGGTGGVGLLLKGGSISGSAESLFTTAGHGIAFNVAGSGAEQAPGIASNVADSNWMSSFGARDDVVGSFGDSAQGWGQTGAAASISDADMRQIAQYAAESLAFLHNLPGNLIQDGGFEADTIGAAGSGKPWKNGGGTPVLLPTSSGAGEGRYVLRMSGNGHNVISDSIQLSTGERIVFGGLLAASSTTLGGIILEDGAGVDLLALRPATADRWQAVTGQYLSTTSQYVKVLLQSPTSGGTDTARFDQIFVFSIPDTLAGGGSVTINFHSGTGNRTVTITTVDSAGGFPAVAGALVTAIDSTSHSVVGHLPSNSSGITTFTLNDGGYYIKTSKPGYRPIYGSSPSPQDSIYLRVSGATSRTDTIEGVAQILPVVAGQCNFYGYVRDVLNDSLIDGLEIQVEFANPPNRIECCSSDTSSTVTIPKFTATTRSNLAGRWEFNLWPSTSLIPTLQYKISFKLNGTVVFSKILTVAGASQRFNP